MQNVTDLPNVISVESWRWPVWQLIGMKKTFTNTHSLVFITFAFLCNGKLFLHLEFYCLDEELYRMKTLQRSRLTFSISPPLKKWRWIIHIEFYYVWFPVYFCYIHTVSLLFGKSFFFSSIQVSNRIVNRLTLFFYHHP